MNARFIGFLVGAFVLGIVMGAHHVPETTVVAGAIAYAAIGFAWGVRR